MQKKGKNKEIIKTEEKGLRQINKQDIQNEISNLKK